MDTRKIGELVNLIPGVNQSRVEKQAADQEIIYYDQASFEIDLNQEKIEKKAMLKADFVSNMTLSEGDVVISNSLLLAVIVGKSNIGKVLSINFTKVEFKDKEFDKQYFIYLFNTNKSIKRQKERELQGMGTIQRIPIRSLEKIKIPYLSHRDQVKIGEMYSETLKVQEKLNQYSGLLEKYTMTVLEKRVEGELK